MSDPAKLAVPVGPTDHRQGPLDAPVELVLYGDYECPYTARAIVITAALRGEFGDGLRFVFRNFPLREIHPHAQLAAEAAEAAAAVGDAQFWAMHGRLFAEQAHLDAAHLAALAAEVGLDPARFGHELAAHSHAARIQADVDSGLASGVEGTPTFFLNGFRHDASYAHDILHAAIAALLAPPAPSSHA